MVEVWIVIMLQHYHVHYHMFQLPFLVLVLLLLSLLLLFMDGIHTVDAYLHLLFLQLAHVHLCQQDHIAICFASVSKFTTITMECRTSSRCSIITRYW
jgi:hypothetical protein